MDFDLDLHDFFAIKEEVDALGIGKFTDDIYEASEGHSILLILNNNVRHSRMDVVQLLKGMKDNALILDAWGVIDYFENVDSHQLEVFTLGTIEIEHT